MNDEQLLLYYYDDGLTDSEKRGIRAALERDSALEARYRDLTAALSVLRGSATPAIPDDLRRRLHATVDRLASLQAGQQTVHRQRSHWTSFWLGAGIAATLAVGIGLGLRQSGPAVAPTDASAAIDTGTTAPPAIFTRAVQVHFRDSRLELATLPDAGNGERIAMIRDLIEQNRVYARLALQNDSPELARLLRAFEPLLVQLAANDISLEESRALREKLAFELNVVLTKLARGASEFSTSTDQDIST